MRGQDASPEDSAAVIALDGQAFDARYHVSPEQNRALFMSNRENGLIVKDTKTGEVVAYSMILPVREDIYTKIRAGQFVDTALTGDMISAFDHPGEYRIYFASVVIRPECRGLLLLRTLIDAMAEDFVTLAEAGIFGKTLTADVVSRDGERLAQLIGLSEVSKTNHGSRIFEVTCLPPQFREPTPTMKRLAEMYRARFSGRA